ncbi:MAG: hypothetical protein LQ350_000864 [Teloschistes chrysophthalmus]|nr:MAG: hypothetical protein LQ350_000864 [Niorma chrysophthalma]
MASLFPPRNIPSILIGFSTKMYLDLPATEKYISSLPQPPPSTALFVVPSFPALPAARKALDQIGHAALFGSPSNPRSAIMLGAQNCSYEDSGAFTGEVSPLMLKQIGCDLVELGHAERRAAPFNETDDMIALKAQAAMRNHLIPLVCIGERTRSSIASEAVGIAIRECSVQVNAVLEALPENNIVIFAYEPVWAIGKNEPAEKDHVLAVIGQLKHMVEGKGRNGTVRWLYGGSAGPGTWTELKSGMDGLFLGRFAHDVNNLEKVLKEVEEDR